MRKRVLLFGPPIASETAAYGGGVGGYTRKMHMYMTGFHNEEFELFPEYHTVRSKPSRITLLGRLVIDIFNLWSAIRRVRPDIIHVLGQYRTAIPRECLAALLARITRTPLLYEIKGGAFVTWYQTTHFLFRAMTRFVIRNSKQVLAQGLPYVELLHDEFAKEAIYFPNFVPVAEIPDSVPERLTTTEIKVLFVGYAYAAKGVFELVTACQRASADVPISLTIVGEEHPDFSRWADAVETSKTFTLFRTGKLSHTEVLQYFATSDVYCYPSRHAGEGHNNTVNEAMMNGLVVVASRAGFLEPLLADRRGYILPGTDVEDIEAALRDIHHDRSEARSRAQRARDFIRRELTDKAAFGKLADAYRVACGLTP